MQLIIQEEKKKKGYIELDTKRDLPLKKAMSAYVLFGNQIRLNINQKYPQGLKVTEIVRLIADEWRKLTKKEK